MTAMPPPPSRRRSNPLRSLRGVLLVILITTRWYLRLRRANRAPLDDEAHSRARLDILHAYTREIVRVFGFTIRTSGPTPPEGALLAPNHLGYADVFVMSAVVRSDFVTRTEYMAWPVIGTIFRALDLVALDRSTTKGLKDVVEQARRRLAAGRSMCVFLEGTSTGGDRVLPFRGPMIRAAADAGVPLVPVGLRWSAGQAGLLVAEDLAYWKDHSFGPHLWRLLGLRGFEVEIVFGEPIDPAGRSTREVADEARARVCELAGLPPRDTLGWPPDPVIPP